MAFPLVRISSILLRSRFCTCFGLEGAPIVAIALIESICDAAKITAAPPKE